MPVDGILPVVPTPFLAGRFDSTSFQRFLDRMLPFVDGYTLLGSTGEAPSLPSDERRAIAEAALAMTPSDKQVIVGVSHTSATESAALAQHAQEHGARGVLCSVPYYFTNTQLGILRHLEAIASAISIDLVLYDNPAATRTHIPAEWALAWAAELAPLSSIKLTDHDLSKIEIWQDGGLSVLAGDDPILFRYLAAGVDGAMVIVPAVFPEAFRRTWELTKEGDELRALRIFNERILPFTHIFGIGDEIATTKALLHDIGVFASDELLPPLSSVGAGRRRLLRAAYDLCVRGDGWRAEGPLDVEEGS